MADDITIAPLRQHLPFGAEIFGLRAEHLGDPSIRDRLRAAWIESGILVFRDVDDAGMHLELSRVFGPLIGHPVQAQDPSRREIMTVRHKPDDAYIVAVDGERLGGWLPWHSDLIHVDRINRGGILRPIRLPNHGGATGFIDKIATYEAMPDALKEAIEGLYVIYQFDRNPEHQKFSRVADLRLIREHSEAMLWRDRVFPRVLHPMVYTQAETGRKLLNVSPWFALSIEGMVGDDGDELLAEVIRYASDERFAYFHEWKLREMVLWDNWRVLHCATGCPPTEERWMERTTIEGDYGRGRVETGATLTDHERVEV